MAEVQRDEVVAVGEPDRFGRQLSPDPPRKLPFLISDRSKRGFLARIRREIRPYTAELYRRYLNRFWGMTIGEDCMISLSARLDRTYPRGIHIGHSSAVNFGAVVLAHDYTRDLHTNTYIGDRCQIGANSFIMPGVTIGDEVIVAPGSVVVTDVASNTIVAGNPARAIERGIRTGRWGKLIRDPQPTAEIADASSCKPPET
jgi:acetyltransferase-like isoleucine patch superfamily enzyme